MSFPCAIVVFSACPDLFGRPRRVMLYPLAEARAPQGVQSPLLLFTCSNYFKCVAMVVLHKVELKATDARAGSKCSAHKEFTSSRFLSFPFLHAQSVLAYRHEFDNSTARLF